MHRNAQSNRQTHEQSNRASLQEWFYFDLFHNASFCVLSLPPLLSRDNRRLALTGAKIAGQIEPSEHFDLPL
jgi:hypothetical protein